MRSLTTVVAALVLIVSPSLCAPAEFEKESEEQGRDKSAEKSTAGKATKERAGGRPEAIAVEPRVIPEPPVPPPPPRTDRFDVDIWTDRDTYVIGDLIRVYFRVTRPCYVYIFDTDTAGRTYQLFPNYYDPDNYVVPGRRYYIPDSRYRLRVVGPPGAEYLRIVAVRYRATFFERAHPFNADEPFPGYSEGTKGFLREYQREQKQIRPVEKESKKLGEQSKGRLEVSGVERKSRPEAIAVEPAPAPRAIVVEPPPVYDREWVEDSTIIRVVPTPAPPPIPLDYGQIDVISQPGGARVSVDGILRGYTPLLLTSVEVGVHTVEIVLPGYHTFTRNIEVVPGQTAVVNVRLRPRGPSWFFDFHIGP